MYTTMVLFIQPIRKCLFPTLKHKYSQPALFPFTQQTADYIPAIYSYLFPHNLYTFSLPFFENNQEVITMLRFTDDMN